MDNWNPGDSPPIRELVDAYGLDVMRIFLDGPDTIPGALVVYQEGIFTLFEHSPSGHKPVLNDQIKEFRQLTHEFEKAVISLTNRQNVRRQHNTLFLFHLIHLTSES